jgi:hypothetical protein
LAKTKGQSVRDNVRLKTAMLREYKSHKGCSRCGENDPRCLDFHHLDPSIKHRFLKRTQLTNGKGYRKGGNTWGRMGYDAILEEVKNCEVVCSNCHRKEFATPATKPETRGDKRRSAFLTALYQL